MRRLGLATALVVLATAAGADELVRLTLKEYARRREESANPAAYERARARFRGVKLGMRSDEFFAMMEMLVVRDRDGRGIDGFCEGHLPLESNEMTRGREPDHFVVFGWYADSKKMKGPVKKFFVVFRHNLLREIGFFDPRDDTERMAGRVNEG